MADYELLPEDSFAQLPEDPGEAFLKLVKIVEDNFEYYSGLANVDIKNLRHSFCQQVLALMSELDLGDLSSSTSTFDEGFAHFQGKVSAVKTRVRIRSRLVGDSDTVALSPATKSRIEDEIENLRTMVERSDLPDRQKANLNKKLDELLEELHRRRLSLSKLAMIAAAIAGVIGGSSTALANGPEAAETVMKILHWAAQDKESEAKTAPRLAPPQKALPAPGSAASDAELNQKEGD